MGQTWGRWAPRVEPCRVAEESPDRTFCGEEGRWPALPRRHPGNHGIPGGFWRRGRDQVGGWEDEEGKETGKEGLGGEVVARVWERGGTEGAWRGCSFGGSCVCSGAGCLGTLGGSCVSP